MTTMIDWDEDNSDWENLIEEDMPDQEDSAVLSKSAHRRIEELLEEKRLRQIVDDSYWYNCEDPFTEENY